ncbi:hypothetical protein [Methylobacterium sp. WL18]|uniref:hypothetical protein n=1 Tax=Methylobacterium sp. WL18 TaxID=2603897 RepID=UPI001FED4A5E|nr:hypothetical protein [Methylobacterium sp. WL18]
MAPAVRFRIEPAYAPPEKIARRLCLTPRAFEECRVQLLARGFPRPDETTGMYDLEAVDRWRMHQSARFYPELAPSLVDAASAAPTSSMGDRFYEAQKRSGRS